MYAIDYLTEKVPILEDDVCDTNLSQEVYDKYRKHFDWKKFTVEVCVSQKGSIEDMSKAVILFTSTIRSPYELAMVNWKAVKCYVQQL